MGGRVALELCRRAPERVRGLALLNCNVQPVRPAERAARAALLQLANSSGMQALAAAWLPPLLARGTDRTRVLAQLTAMVAQSTPQDYAAQLNAILQRPDALGLLSEVRVPTLLLSASEDQGAPASQHETMKLRVPHATVFEVLGAGHMSPIERPDAVALALRQWLRSVAAS